jgi:hypothetical protein
LYRNRLAVPRPWTLLALALALLVSGCIDSALDPLRDRSTPSGLLITEGGTTLVRVDKDVRVTGQLTVGAGKRSGTLEVTFLDHDGNRIIPAGDEFLEVTVTFEDVAAFEQSVPGGFSGRLAGKSAGKTTTYFKLKHGTVGGGYGNWTSPAIDITVTR